jgi:hypothetical protein
MDKEGVLLYEDQFVEEFGVFQTPELPVPRVQDKDIQCVAYVFPYPI